jgi:hypothetical protein
LIEVSDGELRYAMFAQVRAPGVVPPDAMDLPSGWSRSARTLDEPFIFGSLRASWYLSGCPTSTCFRASNLHLLRADTLVALPV